MSDQGGIQPHPVPQNIIDVEFKLFGSFTLKQFSKILIGGVAALIIFALNIPDIVKYPLCLISVLTGIGLAIIPNLGIWINGFFKAIFFSPRYVWVKDTETPEILQNKAKSQISANQKVSSAITTKKIDISDLPLDKLFASKGEKISEEDSLENANPTKDNNFQRVYSDVFGDDIFQRDESSPINQLRRTSNTPQPRSEQAPQADNGSSEKFENEIKKLKFELSMLEKDENYKQKEEEIISRINELYREIKLIQQDKQTNVRSTADLRVKQKITQTLDHTRGKVIIGIVVDKTDAPIANVEIAFLNREDQQLYKTKSLKDGKFSTGDVLEYGAYDITLSDGKHKFHTYSITIGDQNLPAYKFREK